MSKGPKFHIFTAGSPKLGLGHLKRSAVLAEFMESKDYQVRTSVLSSRLDLDSLQLEKSEVAILDLPPTYQKMLQDWRHFHSCIVTLDSKYIRSDINISIYSHSPKISKENFIGFQYAIVADEFITHPSPLANELNNFNNVCICIGGGDVKNQGPSIGQYLTSLGFHVTLIRGPFVNLKYYKNHYPFKIVDDPRQLWEEFHKADWLVVNGGGTMFEGLSMGKAVYSLPQTAEEKLIATKLYMSGALLGVGLKNIKELSFVNASQVTKRARSILDGRGKNRILDLLIERYA